MWNAVGFSDGGWREVPAVTLEGEPFTSSALLSLARTSSSLSDSRLIHYLAQETDVPGAPQSAIELWASVAAVRSREFDWDSPYKIEQIDEALALFPQSPERPSTPVPPTPAVPVTMAWHDRTAVIIAVPAGTEQVVVEYVPGLADEFRIERMRHRYATPEHRFESILEWRTYHGQKSAIVDHWTTMRHAGRSLTASIWGTGTYVVGTVVRRLTLKQPSFDRDPTYRDRLVSMLERHPHIAAQCPDLAHITPTSHERAVVFVHGTVSCGVQALKDLLPPAQAAPGPIYRFEHDTFRAIDENARELADLIASQVEASQLLIAAHSRGGIVARMAGARLMTNHYPGAIEICTFGTPHLGTPLVAMGGRLLNLLFKLGEEVMGSVPVVSHVSKAMGYLIDAPGLPPGIESMDEDARDLATLNTIGDRVPIRSWGSSFDLATAPSGFGVGLEGALAGALADRSHDLVVPTASALAVGMRQPQLTCSHLHYFTEPGVRAAFTGFFAPPAAVPGPTSSVAAMTGGNAPAPEDTKTGIIQTPDYVVIGGIRLPKNKPGGIPVFSHPLVLEGNKGETSAKPSEPPAPTVGV